MPDDWLQRIVRRWPLLVVVGFLGLLIACVTVFPGWLLNATSGHGALSASDRIVDENAIRTTLVQVVGASFFIATAFFSWRTIQLAREGQLTDRYTKAVEQLGGGTTAVRTGGVFALERLARNSPGDRGTITEVLACFVRAASREENATVHDEAALHDDATLRDNAALHSASIQAALVVLGRRHSYDPTAIHTQLNLQRINANHLNLTNVRLPLADFSGAEFSEADLSDSDLARADLRGARLDGAKLSNARLSGADLAGADLKHADLTSADLSKAVLTDATLDHAKLMNADLTGADLSGAKFPRANVLGCNLTGAITSSETVWSDVIGNSAVRWPEGFVPECEGVRMISTE